MRYKRRKDEERRRFENELNEVLCRSGGSRAEDTSRMRE